MSFNFTATDKIQELHQDIQNYLPKFIEHRFLEFTKFDEAVKNKDIESIRAYCHKQKGVAGSYKCYKLEEITNYMHDYALKGEIDEIVAVIPILKAYLYELKDSIAQI